jgi:hypothetical protein
MVTIWNYFWGLQMAETSKNCGVRPKRTSLLHLTLRTSLKNMKSSTSMGQHLENERRNSTKLKLKLALVSNLFPLNAMKEAKERIPLEWRSGKINRN